MSEQKYRRLADADHRHLWHPFTQMQVWLSDEPLIIERGEGNYLIDARGRRYLDGVSSLWCNVHGHRKARLDQALHDQIDRIAHSTMLGLANTPAIELAAALTALVPEGLSRVFYSDSGAEAVEVALRIAAQYWQLAGQPGRALFVTLEEAYHGDTIGSASLGYSEPFHRHIRPLLFRTIKTPPPHVFRFHQHMAPGAADEAALKAAAEIFDQHGKQAAALVIEPLMQGAAGMWSHSAAYLRSIVGMAREAGALVIADEVATGFGRTGAMFACEHAAINPDLLCLGKGITGGYLPLAATLATEQIFEAFLGPPEEFRAFYYGHTYTGNPLAAAVALANLEVFREEQVIEAIAPKIELLGSALHSRFGTHPNVADIRQWGLMAGVELMQSPQARQAFPYAAQTGARIAKAARKAGVLIRPLGDVMVFMPPLSITPSEIEMLVHAVFNATCQIAGRKK
ncbi:MAG TPA: adenosylmethionine--8-amino-7-oxononanoate transaminase [Candidatus Binataceae bacterium]|jgi:adenosylmethionine-8-amino-7-oxononanoate aminotransferase|nr:adenosylmethionine--8-amino-7-oxononanoate transaminase [Candidatus Binataceae bacterium]